MNKVIKDKRYAALKQRKLEPVASGEMSRLDLLATFWEGFQPQLRFATEYALALQRERLDSRPQAKPIGEACPECGGDLVQRHGPNGPFVGCASYPKCTYTRSLDYKPLVLHPTEVKP
jgi:DNA topoisomerase-1